MSATSRIRYKMLSKIKSTLLNRTTIYFQSPSRSNNDNASKIDRETYRSQKLQAIVGERYLNTIGRSLKVLADLPVSCQICTYMILCSDPLRNEIKLSKSCIPRIKSLGHGYQSASATKSDVWLEGNNKLDNVESFEKASVRTSFNQYYGDR